MKIFAEVAVPTFGEVVRDRAAIRPDAVAVRFADRRWTYHDLDVRSDRIANDLALQGLSRGDRVAFLGKNSDAVPLLALGVSKAGMIFVPINWRLAPLEIEHILKDAGARLLYLDDAKEDLRLLSATARAGTRIVPAEMLTADRGAFGMGSSPRVRSTPGIRR